jgi:hypothetical protein
VDTVPINGTNTSQRSREAEKNLVDFIRKDMIEFGNKYSLRKVNYQLSNESWFKCFLYEKSRFVLCFNEFLEEEGGDLIFKVRKLKNCLLLKRIFENPSLISGYCVNIFWKSSLVRASNVVFSMLSSVNMLGSWFMKLSIEQTADFSKKNCFF